jgi:hypothetical protein
MPINENITDDFDLSDLDLGALSVTSMLDSAALPETGASYTSSSCCYVAPEAS